MEPCSSLADLRPGDIGFGPLAGVADPAAWLGQFILGEGFHVGRMNAGHVFVVVESGRPNPPYPDGKGNFYPRCVEAMPRGAREMHIGDGRLTWPMVSNRWSEEYAYVRLREDYPGQGEDAAAIAKAMIGTPYSFASYAALAAWRFGLKVKRLEKWIDRRKPQRRIDGWNVELPCEAICSVLADQAWSLTGKKIMPGVAHQCVTPGALARRLLEMAACSAGQDAVWTFPGR